MPATAPAIIFDAHLDIAFNAVDWNRDLRMSVTEIRTHEIALGMTEPGHPPTLGHQQRPHPAVPEPGVQTDQLQHPGHQPRLVLSGSGLLPLGRPGLADDRTR